MKLPFHSRVHASLHVCCLCGNRYPSPLLEVWASANWHPVCRPCLDDIGLGLFGPFTSGPRVRANGKGTGQQVLL